MTDEAPVIIGEKKESGTEKCEKLLVTLYGETFEIPYTTQESIIEVLLDEGFNPPYSCLEGNCMACMGKVTKGAVEQKNPGILTEDNVANNEALTCQARPITSTVAIDYDDI